MVEVNKAGFLADFLFKFMDGAGGVDGLDGAAIGADEVVAMLPGEEESEVGGALVKTEAADHSFFAETLNEAEDGGFVTLLGEVSAGGQIGQGHGPVVVGKTGEDGFEGFCFSQAGGSGFCDEVFVERAHVRGKVI